MSVHRRVRPAVAVTMGFVAIGLVTTSCSRVRNHKGYFGDTALMQSIQPGVDNRESVQATLGRPTFESQFTSQSEAPTWYYVSRDTRQLAFAHPSPSAQDILAIRFDGAGNVAMVDTIGLENVASINPSGDETPTLGRDRSLWDELFGNIGAAGAATQGGSTADNPTGGN